LKFDGSGPGPSQTPGAFMKRIWIIALAVLAGLGFVREIISNRASIKSDSRSVVAAEQVSSRLYQGSSPTNTLIGSLYKMDTGDDGSYLANNLSQQFKTSFSVAGASITPLNNIDQTVAIRLSGLGYGDDLSPVFGEPTLETHANRIEFEYQSVNAEPGSIIEWYVNNPTGLEHGFTLGEPRHRTSHDLRIALELSGDLHPRSNVPSKCVELRSVNGATVLTYNELHAFDANGVELASQMSCAEGHIYLEVDDRNATYPVTIDPNWTQQAELIDPDPVNNDNFGSAIALSNDTVAVGAHQSCSVFIRAGSSWSFQQKLTLPSDPLGFGGSVALEGDTLVVGAAGDNLDVNGSGAAYVFSRSGTTWTQQQRLTASDPANNDNFGATVGISGNTIAIGATGADVGTNFGAGAVYVFVRSGATWSQQQQLNASDSATNFGLGRALSISGNSIVAGTFDSDVVTGAAYVFVRNGTTWSQQQRLAQGQADDHFGCAVSIDADTVVVGAFGDDVGANPDQGSAFVFTRTGTVWSLQQRLNASTGSSQDGFGKAVSINGDLLVVGASFDDIGTGLSQGAAYVFFRSGTSWSQQQRLTAADAVPGSIFGDQVAIEGHYIVVGSPFAPLGTVHLLGAAYVFLENSPNPIVVTNTNDSGAGSLRQAITTANSFNGPDIISFNIPGAGVKTIIPLSPLPALNEQVTIDGTAQPGYSGTPLIEINGQSAGIASGLTLTAGNSTIKGLIINRFAFNGIVLSTNGNDVVQGCYIGTDATGTLDRGNIVTGIKVSCPNNLIGGASASARNVISGNDQLGIVLLTGATNNSIQNNWIGLSANGTATIANANGGVVIDTGVTINTISGNFIAGNPVGINLLGSNNSVIRNTLGTASNGIDPLPNATNILISGNGNSIGSIFISDKNVIAFATGAGVAVTGGTGNSIRYNSVYSNGGLGVDLGNDGVTQNDAGDADSGPNNLLNYPVINSANVSGTSITIRATLNSTPQTIFAVDFFWSPSADPSGFGEGQNYFGTRQVLTDDSGNTSFSATLSPFSIPGGSVITAITRDATNNTSEFSRAAIVGDSTACGTLELNPTSATQGDAGGSGQVNVINSTGCNWNAVSNSSWINITSGSIGSGVGVVGYTVAVNPNPGAPRTGTMTIGGRTFTVFQSHGPTAIHDLTASVTSFDNGTLIEWRTSLEVANLGFNLYRDSATRIPINKQLIAGSALVAGARTTMTSGRAYSWFDSSAVDSSVGYWVEAVDINGRSSWHGPFGAAKSTGRLADFIDRKPLGLSDLGRQAATGESHTTPQRETTFTAPAVNQTALKLQGLISSNGAIKISVGREGWYRVSQSQLIQAGLSPKTDPRFLRLFADGTEQPILVNGENDGSFDATDSIEFYGLGLDTPSTATHVYWLVVGDVPGNRVAMTESFGKPGGFRSFAFTAELKERTIYAPSLLNGDAENFFGAVVASQPVDQTLTIRNNDGDASTPGVLEVALQGVTDLQQSPDHQVRVMLNGNFVGLLTFDGQSRKAAKFEFPQSVLKDGENKVTLTAEAGGSDVSLVDYVRLTYSHTVTAEQDSLRLEIPGGVRSQTIDGFSSADIRVFDVTAAPLEIIRLAGRVEKKPSSYSITVDLASNKPRKLLALSMSQALSPSNVAPDISSRWQRESNGADLVIITTRELVPAFERFALHRRGQGVGVALIDIEDIYDEFNFGNKSPQAIKEFLSYTTTRWKKAPRYVLLGGDASYDPRNYLGFGATDLVPTKLIDTRYMETASDDWFADRDNDGVPEISVGRLPARTADEAALMVDKLIRYDQSKSSDEAIVVADRGDGFDFDSASIAIEPMLTGLRPTEIFRSRMDDSTARSRLLEALNRGPQIVNYAGHGWTDMWRGNLLTSSDARSLENSHLSLFVMMDCLNGYFHDVALDSLGESLLKAERGGAVAVWASSGMTGADGQATINREFYRRLYGDRLTIGDAARAAKTATTDLDIRRTWILLGDPMTRVW
jgi:hypothetical protein